MHKQVRMTRAALMAAGALLCSNAAFAQDDGLRAGVQEDMPELMELYRDLHANPELSFEEDETAAKLAARMRTLGFEVTEGVGKTGVVAVMENGEGPTVLIRADMDGLPVIEQTGLPFASTVKATPATGVETGVMHACGHDTHMTAWIGAAQQLVDHKDEWSGTLVMILQPAEEVGEGALAMLEDGLFTRFPKPDYAIAFHDAAQFPAGTIGYSPGYALANVDSVDITVKGVGGHGAYPQSTKDPVVLASSIVMKLQTLVSRELSPLEPGVVTVGSFRAGSKHNIISDEAKLQLTVRSYTDEARKLLLDGIARIARGEAIAAGIADDQLPVVTVADPYTPSTFNDPEFTETVMTGFRTRFGEDRVMQVPSVMGGEDFSQYRRADPDGVESLIFWIGGVPEDEWQAAQNGEGALPSLHSPFWAPDAEKVIETGAEALAAAAIDLMPAKGG
ncbi:peptidase M20 [Citromicrobium sp. RCC1885]|uniref:amidohydrolase n=1 Tax=unclassified Citromicrobium TaxID=2630544 RepID=UPI0006C904AA|nr:MULTISPECIES: amidohydrolase [unclassified Citromicrobium]KPM25436.1 peptidase M20 [Citromicrobium sp. RCC1885]KPM28678.1 peptidase M20 [Citromicrobium sp. RCC1878]MAO03065.1 amidohydrolase [Citromicrobium sp.]OAM09776.1 peptidase M20 [Citromicrobium sp. RCC1897]|tara:strand:- start:111 stop:1457 length:1347 start_codon:yes stop_codon:yes gene_type:complete